MKISVYRTSYFFKIDRYPAKFGYRHPDGKEDTINEGEIINIRIFGIEINFYMVKKKYGQNPIQN